MTIGVLYRTVLAIPSLRAHKSLYMYMENCGACIVLIYAPKQFSFGRSFLKS